MKVLWFSCDKYMRSDLERMYDKRKYEIALSDDEYTMIWDDIYSFQGDLNDDNVDTENGFVYFIKDC